MGALHAGHLALVEEAAHQADRVVVSIFVNPTQFGPSEDFDAYPRTLAEDLAKLEGLPEVVAVFAPTVEAMYPGGQAKARFWVQVEGMDTYLCGRYRPGHFRGVTTVVAKLFNLCKPHVAVFGLKDAQQFLILRRMVEEFNFDVEMVGVPTVREADGLALSSRNRYLRPEERAEAVVLSRAVRSAAAAVTTGERTVAQMVAQMQEHLGQASLAQVQYAEVVDTAALQPLTTLEPGQEVLAAVAVYFGETRLIDNAFITVPEA